MKKALFPGTFDPFTTGHLSVVRRALTFMDEIIIAIGVNSNKKTYYTATQREKMLHDFFADEPRIKVASYDGLTIDFAQEMEAQFIVRGIRTVKDFEYEETIADINRQLANIETILLFTEPNLTCVSSTTVRELLSFGKDVSQFVPKGIHLPQK
jgi:pantetheine-phosphate adenylyltransferase